MLTKITGTGTGVAPVVNLTFPFINTEHVKAAVNGATAALMWTGVSQVTFASPVAAGLSWSVYRQTPTAPLVDFTDNAVLEEHDLDLAHRQHQYIDEETADALDELGLGATYTDENARDAIGSALVAGANVSINVNDPADQITISASMDQEVIRDTMAAALVAGPNVTITTDDAANTITITSTGGGGGGALTDGDYGDITVSGSGTVMTIDAHAVTVGKLAAMSANSILGNNTGAAASPTSLTGSQVTALLSPMLGDVGGGGVKGVVPAPASGDAAAGKFLKADGTWAVPTSAGGTTTNLLTFNNGGAGAGSGVTFNGSAPVTISYNSIGAAAAFSPVSSFSANRTLSDADNNVYLKFTGSSAATLTADASTAQGLLTIVANRGSVPLTLSIPVGGYKNGGVGTATSGSLAIGGKITLFHEGSGVWTLDGTGLS